MALDGPRLAGRYAVLGSLGEGGMGVVLRVADTLEDGRALALKTLPTADRPELVERLRVEFLLLRGLDHPNVARVYDFGVLEERAAGGTGLAGAYFTSELCPGGTLLAWAAGRPPGEILRVLRQACDALAYVHARGLLHRDVKPANFIVAEAGGEPVLKLIDFGLTTRLERAARPGEAVGGTVDYLAPEIARGEPADVRTDLYALGVTFYEVLTGRLPFHGDSDAEVLRAHATAAPLTPSRHRPELPAAIDELVLRLVARAPAERFQSADEVAEALDVATGNAPPPGRRAAAAMLSKIPFAARDQALRAALAWAEGGAAPVLLVRGQAGMGKSRLLDELRSAVQLAGGTALQGRCTRAGRGPLAAWVGALRALVAHAGVNAPAVRAAAAELAALVPELAGQGGAAGESARDRFGVLSRLATFIEEAAPDGLMIAIEDLHWADTESAELFFLLARRLVAAPAAARRVRLAGSWRPDERGGAAAGEGGERAGREAGELERRARDVGGAVAIDLAPLDAAGGRALLRGAFGGADLPESLAGGAAAATGGSPLLLATFARSLVESGAAYRRGGRWIVAEPPPDAAALASAAPALLGGWVASLGARERGMLEVLALALWPLDVATAAGVAQLDLPQALESLSALVGRGHAKAGVEGGTVLFEPMHALVAERAAEQMAPARARAVHLRLAETLAAGSGGTLAPTDEEIAHHLARGGAPARAKERRTTRGTAAPREPRSASDGA